jgi:hypothetical protein
MKDSKMALSSSLVKVVYVYIFLRSWFSLVEEEMSLIEKEDVLKLKICDDRLRVFI